VTLLPQKVASRWKEQLALTEHELVAENALDFEFKPTEARLSKGYHQRDNRRAGDDRSGKRALSGGIRISRRLSDLIDRG
jgi:hypothetical protein